MKFDTLLTYIKNRKLRLKLLKIKKIIEKKIVNYWLKIILKNIHTYYDGPISKFIFKFFNEPSLIGNIVRTIYNNTFIFNIDTYFAKKEREKALKEFMEWRKKKTRKVINGKLYYD